MWIGSCIFFLYLHFDKVIVIIRGIRSMRLCILLRWALSFYFVLLFSVLHLGSFLCGIGQIEYLLLFDGWLLLLLPLLLHVELNMTKPQKAATLVIQSEKLL